MFRMTRNAGKYWAQSSVEHSVVVRKPSWMLVSLKILLSFRELQTFRMSSFSKSSIMIDLSRLTLTTFLLSKAEEGFLKTGPKLHLRPESVSDTNRPLSLITGCDFLLLGTVLLGKWLCLSGRPSPLCNGKFIPWLMASLWQAIETERGLLWLSEFFEVKKAKSLRRSPFMFFCGEVASRQRILTGLMKGWDRVFKQHVFARDLKKLLAYLSSPQTKNSCLKVWTILYCVVRENIHTHPTEGHWKLQWGEWCQKAKTF